MRFEEAANIRDLISTVEEMEQKQKMAAAEGDDADIFAFYAETPLVAVNLFHMRNGHIVDRREFFWEEQIDLNPAEFFEALMKQVYLNQPYIPGLIHVPVDFEDLEDARRVSVREAGPEGRDPDASAGAEKGDAFSRRDKREAQFRRAISSDEAVLADHRGGSAGRVSARLNRRNESNASTSPTFKAPTRSPAWWSGKTAR